MHVTLNVHAVSTAHAHALVSVECPGTIVRTTEHPRTTTFTHGRLHFLFEIVVYVLDGNA